MRIIGLDIHRAFAEAVAWDEGELKRLGRVDMRRHLLEAFAKKLSKEDVVVVEATGNASSVAAVIAPHVKKVVIANPKQVRIIAHAKIKTDTIDASVLAQLYASGFLPEVWIPDEPTSGASPASDPAQSDRPTAIAIEEYHSVDPAQPSDPLLSARRSVRGKRTGMAFSPGLAGGRTARRRTPPARVRSARRGPQSHRARSCPLSPGGLGRQTPDDKPRGRHGGGARHRGRDRRRGTLRAVAGPGPDWRTLGLRPKVAHQLFRLRPAAGERSHGA